MDHDWIEVLTDVDGILSSKRVMAFILLLLFIYVVVVQKDTEMASIIGWFIMGSLGITIPDRFSQQR